MKKCVTILAVILLIAIFSSPVMAQCSVCSKTALQMGEKPARALNTAIIYLMLAPFAIIGVLGYRWWKSNKGTDA